MSGVAGLGYQVTCKEFTVSGGRLCYWGAEGRKTQLC